MTLTDVATRWAESGIAHASPATAAEIAAFEADKNVHLPDDVRAYFLTLNGMALGRDGAVDDQLIAFWRFDEFAPGAELEDGRRLFWFADFLIDSHRYAVALSQHPGPAPVFIDHVTQVVRIADSFDAFLKLYLKGDEDALAGGTPIASAS